MGDLRSLLPVTPQPIGATKINAVNGRDLHAFLGIGKVFAAWITESIDAYGFIEHRDFEVFSDSGKNPQGGRPAKEYLLSLSMAKELAMVQRNAKGKEARAYFLECESIAQDPVHRLLTMSRTEILEMALAASRERDTLAAESKRQQEAIAMLEPKAEFHDTVMRSQDTLTVAKFAKILGTGEIRLFRWLREAKVLMEGNVPYQHHLDEGHFKVVENPIKIGSSIVLKAQTLITPKGQVYLQKRWTQQA